MMMWKSSVDMLKTLPFVSVFFLYFCPFPLLEKIPEPELWLPSPSFHPHIRKENHLLTNVRLSPPFQIQCVNCVGHTFSLIFAKTCSHKLPPILRTSKASHERNCMFLFRISRIRNKGSLFFFFFFFCKRMSNFKIFFFCRNPPVLLFVSVVYHTDAATWKSLKKNDWR